MQVCAAPEKAKKQVSEEVLGGIGFSEFFLSIVSALTREQLIMRSPKGKVILELLQAIQHLQSDSVANIAIRLVSEVNTCLYAGKRHKLPSMAQGAVWSAFHQLRGKQALLQAWTGFVEPIAPRTCSEVSSTTLALQVILNRIVKKMISNQAASMLTSGASKEQAIKPLTFSEVNTVRYMAGYVVIKLLKRYRKGSKIQNVAKKHKLFVRVLERMKAVEQPGEPDSISEYSTLWQELIDRGGLYHINDDVFNLMQAIEVVVRGDFNKESIASHEPGTNVGKIIRQKIMNAPQIMTLWEKIACDIPDKYELYSIELLGLIGDLWITIRGHSFAKHCTMMSQRKYKRKGLRKDLKEVN